MDQCLSIVGQPHQVLVDEAGEIVPSFMARASMAYERRWNKIRSSPCKPIQRARYPEDSIRVHRLVALGVDPINAGVPGDMADE